MGKCMMISEGCLGDKPAQSRRGAHTSAVSEQVHRSAEFFTEHQV